MKALLLEQQGGTEAVKLGHLDRPKPRDTEVLIQVHAAAVTPTELQWFPTFHQPSGAPRPFPIVLGHEFSGVIASIGHKVSRFEVGDEVIGLNDWFVDGAQAEFCVVEANSLARKPALLDHPHASVVPISALTAWQGLFERGQLQRDQQVLIHGGSGAVGLFAVQLSHWRGAHVIATASSSRSDFLQSLGAEEVIDYKTRRFEDAVPEVDVVFDTVGGETLDRSWKLLKKGGRMITIATPSEGVSDQRVRDAFLLVRSDGTQLAEIGKLIDARLLRAFVAQTFPLEAGREAYRNAAQGGLRGKVVIQVTPEKSPPGPLFSHSAPSTKKENLQ